MNINNYEESHVMESPDFRMVSMNALIAGTLLFAGPSPKVTPTPTLEACVYEAKLPTTAVINGFTYEISEADPTQLNLKTPDGHEIDGIFKLSAGQLRSIATADDVENEDDHKKRLALMGLISYTDEEAVAQGMNPDLTTQETNIFLVVEGGLKQIGSAQDVNSSIQ